MSDLDKTVYSGGGAQGLAGAPQSSAQSPKPKRNPLLIIGGIGCVLLICAALLIGGGLYFFGDQLNDLVAGLSSESETPALDIPTATLPAATPAATEEPAAEAGSGSEVAEKGETEAVEPTTPVEEETPVEETEPTIGPITFALGSTDNYEPVSPGTSFEEGITEIHAIFDYSGMSPDFTWERVWYLDGNEILRNSAEWTGDEQGRFDYFIDAGGDPLSPGEWDLELYVEGSLLAKGSFAIETKDRPEIAEAGADAEHAADLATPTPAPTPTKASPAGGSGGGVYQLAYTKWDGGNHNIYVADTNGNNEQLIVTRGAGPSWTPDGRYIFFYGEEGVDRQIRDGQEYINPNYSVSNGIVRVTMSPFPANVTQLDFFQGPGWNDGTARWASVSPDGQMVAFDAKPGGSYRIYFLGTADNQQFRFEIVGEQGDWSPDSQKIVYRSGRDGKTGIWISNRDDTGHTLITDGGSDSFPAWSPDGRTIAFSRDEGGNVDIYTVNVDGSNLQRLTDAPDPDTLPTYTPSGDIIFRSARTGSWGIWKMSGSGGNQTEIIPNAGVGPDWAYSKMDVR